MTDAELDTIRCAAIDAEARAFVEGCTPAECDTRYLQVWREGIAALVSKMLLRGRDEAREAVRRIPITAPSDPTRD